MSRTRDIAMAVCLLSGVVGVSAASAQPTRALTDSFLDYDGDGKVDPVIVRNVGGGPSGAVGWWIRNSSNGSATYTQWGIASDTFVGGDFDGDGKADVAIWRPGAQAEFWVRQSSNGGTLRIPFGTTGDDPTVLNDFDDDGISDAAIYRPSDSTWWVRRSSNGAITSVKWGAVGSTFPASGDYDGDGKSDYTAQIGNLFWTLRSSDNGASIRQFGTPTDSITPGDWDNDGKTDLSVSRASGGQLVHFHVASSNPNQNVYATYQAWGASATDFRAQGDYDGDGQTDNVVYRAGSTGYFWLLQSTNGVAVFPFGTSGDYPVANYNVH